MDDNKSYLNKNSINSLTDDGISVMTATQESVDYVIDTRFELITETIPPCTFDRMANNFLLIEFQTLIVVACYEATPANDIMVDEQAQQIHAQFFSNTMQVGFSEQLHRGLCNFANLFDQVPVERHGLESSNTLRHRLRVK